MLLPVYPAEGESVVQFFKFYIVNETSDELIVQYREFLNGNLAFEIKSDVVGFNQLYIKDFPFDALNDHPRLEFIFSLVNPKKNSPSTYRHELKLKPKQVMKRLDELQEKSHATFGFLFFKQYPAEKASEKITSWFVPKPREKPVEKRDMYQGLSQLPYEIDLHIEKLTEDAGRMSASDMLFLQLTAFRNVLDRAIAHGQLSLVVIHGVGKGVLKREVHEILKRTPEVDRFVNQYDFRYGFRATEIFFKYD